MVVWLGLAAFELKVQGYRTSSSSDNYKANNERVQTYRASPQNSVFKELHIIDVKKHVYHLI